MFPESRQQPKRNSVEVHVSIFSAGNRREKLQRTTSISRKKVDANLKSRVAEFLALHLALAAVPLAFSENGMVEDIMGLYNVNARMPCLVTVNSKVAVVFQNSFRELCEKAHKNVLKGCITFDGWSQHGRKFNGVTFHYMEHDFTPRSLALALEECNAQSTGEIICAQIGK